jgi:hypothetical protein
MLVEPPDTLIAGTGSLGIAGLALTEIVSDSETGGAASSPALQEIWNPRAIPPITHAYKVCFIIPPGW